MMVAFLECSSEDQTILCSVLYFSGHFVSPYMVQHIESVPTIYMASIHAAHTHTKLQHFVNPMMLINIIGFMLVGRTYINLIIFFGTSASHSSFFGDQNCYSKCFIAVLYNN